MTSLPSLSVIEFPGVLSDPHDSTRAFACLGGEQAVRRALSATYHVTSATPTLNLRPGPHSSPSNIQPEKPVHLTNLFVLEYQVDELQQINDHPQSNRAEASRTDADPVQLPAAHGHIIGRVDTLLRYRSLADYAYHARKGVSAPLNHDDASNQTAANCIFRAIFLDRQAQHDADSLIERLRPRRFARTAPEYGNLDYWFRQYSCGDSKLPTRTELIPNHPLGDDRRSDVNRIALLHHRVPMDVENVPDGPELESNAPSLRGRCEYDQCLNLMRKLFQIRPIWVRRALQEGIPKELARHFKRVIPQVAYAFQGTGPFYQAWIRYGYDPRKDPTSRKFQTMDIRITNTIIVAARMQCEQDNNGRKDEARSQVKDTVTRPKTSSAQLFESGTSSTRAKAAAESESAPEARDPVAVREMKQGGTGGEHTNTESTRRDAGNEVNASHLTSDAKDIHNIFAAGDKRAVDGTLHASRNDRQQSTQEHETGAESATGDRKGRVDTAGDKERDDEMELPAPFRMPGSFTLSQIPCKRNNFIQICDIRLPEVISYCDGVERTDKFDTRFGFFTQEGHEGLMRTVKDTLLKMSKKLLGEERVRQIKRGDYSSVGHLLVNRKRRLFLKDVIRPRKRMATGRGAGAKQGLQLVSRYAGTEGAEAVEVVKDLEGDGDGNEGAGLEGDGDDELAEVDGFALLDEDEDDDDDEDEEGDDDDDEDEDGAVGGG